MVFHAPSLLGIFLIRSALTLAADSWQTLVTVSELLSTGFFASFPILFNVVKRRSHKRSVIDLRVHSL